MPDVDQMLHAARAQEQQQRQLQAVLQQAMSQPHTVTQHTICTVAVRYDEVAPGRRQAVLMIGTLDGHRRDVALSGPMAVALAKALQSQPEPMEELAA